MKLQEFADQFGLDVCAGTPEQEIAVEKLFCCDLLSLAMARATEHCCWLTVMGNLNAVAVASLADAACIVVCEGMEMDKAGLAKAREEEIPVLRTAGAVFDTALRIHDGLFGRGGGHA